MLSSMAEYLISFTSSETFSFVLTGEDGSRRFGYCRRLLVCTSKFFIPLALTTLNFIFIWIILNLKFAHFMCYQAIVSKWIWVLKWSFFSPLNVISRKDLFCSIGLILWLHLDEQSCDTRVFWVCLFLACCSQPSGKGRRLPEVYCIVSRLGCFDLFSKVGLSRCTQMQIVQANKRRPSNRLKSHRCACDTLAHGYMQPTFIKWVQTNITLAAHRAPPTLHLVDFPKSLLVLAQVQRHMWTAADVVTAVVNVPHIVP